jgi:hypothetical protein
LWLKPRAGDLLQFAATDLDNLERGDRRGTRRSSKQPLDLN